MAKYTVSFQSVDFGRRIEMALYDGDKRAFVIPNFEYTKQGRLFMAGTPREFADFVNALVTAWNEYLIEQRRRATAVTEDYGEAFLEGFHEARGAAKIVEDDPTSPSGTPDQGTEGPQPDDEVRRIGPG